jgi:adenylosuccinate lyase
MGKEISVFTYRLNRTLNQVYSVDFLGKFNGAVGNFNAHDFSFPELDWLLLSKKFINSLDLKENMYTTQIESHDFLSEIFDASKRLNNIMLGLSKDFWGYISCNYFLQKVKKNEVGSSTMPHKINPIDFENAEGNLGISNSIFNHLSEKLSISRFQRDLSDSTAMRNIGVAFAHQKIAIDSLIKGLNKLEINKKVLSNELKNQWDLLAEPIQNIMKLNSIDNAYEKLKSLTRNNNKINKKDLNAFVKKLKILPKHKKLLLNANPTNYTGIAKKLAKNIKKVIENE